MPELCELLDITLNELFAGEKLDQNEYKTIADQNLLEALENSAFTLKEKIQFYKKKWKKEHVFNFALGFIVWLGLLIALKLKDVDAYLIGGVSGLIGVLFYISMNNQMMIYVENKVYEKTERQQKNEK